MQIGQRIRQFTQRAASPEWQLLFFNARTSDDIEVLEATRMRGSFQDVYDWAQNHQLSLDDCNALAVTEVIP